MELLQLKYFCDAAATQNFSETARKFFVPPSDISQSIKRLERELGKPLFERQANRIFLNAQGEEFYKKVYPAINTIESAAKLINEDSKKSTAKICILIRRHIVMDTIEQFSRKEKSLNFIATHTLPSDILSFDIIVSDDSYDIPHTKTMAATESFILAYNKNFFEPDINLLFELGFITMPPKSSIYKTTHAVCQNLGFKPNIILQSEDPYYIRRCIELGLGVAVVPETSWRGLFSENIGFMNIGDYQRNIYVYKKSNSITAIDDFYDFLIQKIKSNME